jgi:hypothetical protein
VSQIAAERTPVDNANKAIGGYFELDCGGGETILPDGVLLNSGRNALRHIVRKLHIRHIHVPYYTCPVVADALAAEGCVIERYSIDENMMPAKEFGKDESILYVNYFGVCGANVDLLSGRYANLIVDCAQAFFAKPKGRASCSSPRKFFGVPDGGVAYGVETGLYEEDVSDCRKGHLIERKVHGATPRGYELFRMAEASLAGTEVMGMSRFTRECLIKADMTKAKERRLENFAYLQKHLPTSFPLALASDDVPMVYPYLTEDSGLRMRLIRDRIYVAVYWPGVCNCGNMPDRIVPLPIDQRYGAEDMERIVDAVISCRI